MLCQLSYGPTNIQFFSPTLAGPAGFEPATNGFEARYSIQLSYEPQRRLGKLQRLPSGVKGENGVTDGD
jgi:hypothetical protein